LWALPDLKENLLHHVLRQGGLFENTKSNAVDNSLVAVKDRCHGVLASFGHCFKQRGVIHGLNLFALSGISIFTNSTMEIGSRIERR
jgi:hypothetical protein